MATLIGGGIAGGDITGVTAGTNCSGGGTSGTVTINVDDAFIKNDADDATSGALTVTGAAGVTIKDATTSSATEGGNLILASDDGAVMASGHRLGVIEFKGAEDGAGTLTNGARIQCVVDSSTTWSGTENDAWLQFYTTNANASESLVLTLDQTKTATFTGGTYTTGDSIVAGNFTLTGAGGATIKDSTTSSATEGGNLILASDDGAVMGSGHRLGVIEFKGAEDTGGTLTTGARIEALADAAWSASENGADLVFYTTDGNASESEVMRATASTGVSIPKRKMSVSTTVDGNAGSGDIVYFGTGSSVVGKIYHYKSDGSWELADANAAANCDGLLAVAIGTDPDVDGMLLRGMVTLIDIQGTEAVGDVLYLSESATGAADCVAPAGNLDIVRVIGYCLSTDDQIWFNPDNTFVEVTA